MQLIAPSCDRMLSTFHKCGDDFTFRHRWGIVIGMKATAEQLTHDVLSLPDEERRGVFLKLASSLPEEVSHLAESSRRAEELRSGSVMPMAEDTFRQNLQQLRSSFRASPT